MVDIEFLFRFRDLVAPTIKEHKKVIDKHGWCWWGWWKRPSEDGRTDIWKELSEIILKDGKVTIGLFDSGSDKLYPAQLIGIIQPDEKVDIFADNTIKVPKEEEDRVPPYYRESPFSRAWMKLDNIADENINFTGKYSFAEAPKLANYDDSLLRRFIDKKIYSGEELRSMDTTIWRIRPAKDGDHSEQIILSSQALSTPLSNKVIRCKHNTILHLTDLHFSTAPNRDQHVWRYDSEGEETRNTMVEAIGSVLKTEDHKIGLLVVSGDFTFVGSKEEFAEAKTAILHLLGMLDLSTDHLVIVPGNHDIQWTTDDSYEHNSPVRQAPPKARANYEAFYRELMRHEPNRHLAMARRFAFPSGRMIELCALNSSSLETGKDFLAGMGRTDEAAFSEVSEVLGWSGHKSAAVRMMVIHHHLALTEDLEPADGYGKGYGLAVDAVRIQRMARQKGVHLALHGHKHRSFIWRSTVYELPEHTKPQHRLGELSIIGGGSAGSSDTDGDSNYFNLLVIEPANLKLVMFQSKNQGAFAAFQKWNAELTISDQQGGLALGDWTLPG